MERYAPCESPLNRAPFYGQGGARPVDAFDALTWRAAAQPPVVVAPDQAPDPTIPRWMVVALGCLIAALLGVIAGSMLAL